MIKINVIPHNQQRYPTVGDYYYDSDGNLQINISKQSNKFYEYLIAIHELCEVCLTEHKGIPEEIITMFDLENPQLDDPGSSPLAPYHREHMASLEIEKFLCEEMGLNWDDYENNL